MRYELGHLSDFDRQVSDGLALLPWRDDLLRSHARVKHESFRQELDAIVFPCLAQADGCLKLMNDIRRRSNFVPEATFLAVMTSPETGTQTPVGTIQGLRQNEWEGSIQNIGVVPDMRGRGIGRLLLNYALHGFLSAGCKQVYLEVTTHNVSAVRLYERIGFESVQTVFKASEVPGF